MTEGNIRFVTRLKRGAGYAVLERRDTTWKPRVTSDQTIQLTGKKARVQDLILRRIGYRDPETGKRPVFLTNDFDLAATMIAKIYRERWTVDPFFKWINQHPKIKSFPGRSHNAVLTQFRIATIAYLMLAYLKFQLRLGWSLRHILHLLQLTFFERRDVAALLQNRTSRPDPPNPHAALVFS